jgi:hypothetical protein
MTRQVKCECGYVARGETDDAVVDLIEAHVASDHPELVGSVTRSTITRWIELVPA